MKTIFNYAHHLGFNNPYYFVDQDSKLEVDVSFQSIMNKQSGSKSINPKAIVSFLSWTYFLGDNCIVNEINRSPWMATPDNDKSKWQFYDLPKHGSTKVHEKEIADQLFELLCEEIKDYVGDAKSVGILLSGGMDSRMLAGCLYHMIKHQQVDVHRVVAYTWGDKNSRDHIYAKRLAENLGWEFQYFHVGAKEIWENIMLAGTRGCEYSGIHLHAMPQIAETNDVDILFAGSYGDSVGRAEYSGSRVDKVKSIEKGLKNKLGLIESQVFESAKTSLLKDINSYHKIFPRDKNYQQNELDRQLHYMRRKLNACMEVINDKTPLYQIFTSPKVFGYMWSLDLSVRNDKVYFYLLEKFSTKISQIPWARTGKRFMIDEEPDKFKKVHHSYSDIIQHELYDKILSYVNDNRKLVQYINIEVFNSIMEEIKKYPKHNFDYLEVITWVVSYTRFLVDNKNLIEANNKNSKNKSNHFVKIQYRTKTRLRNLKNRIK